MVAIAGEVCLARHADTVGVGDVASFVARTAVVAVGLVVAGPDHVRLDRGDRSHLVVEGVQDALICLRAFCDSDVGKVALDGLLEPVVCICDVSGWWFAVSVDRIYRFHRNSKLTMPKEVEARKRISQRLDGVLFTGLQRVRRSSADMGGQSERAHGAQINHDCSSERSAISSSATGDELIGSSRVATLRQVVILGVGLEASEPNVVVIGGRCVVGHRYVGAGVLIEAVCRLAEGHVRLRKVRVCVPGHMHAIAAGVGEAQLHGRAILARALIMVGGQTSACAECKQSECGRRHHAGLSFGGANLERTMQGLLRWVQEREDMAAAVFICDHTLYSLNTI